MGAQPQTSLLAWKRRMCHVTSHDDAQGFQDLLENLRRHGCRVLVTSRCQIGLWTHHHLGSLSPEHSAGLLREQAGASRVTLVQSQKLAQIC